MCSSVPCCRTWQPCVGSERLGFPSVLPAGTHDGHRVHATEIVQQRYLEMDEMKQLLLPTVLQMLRDSRDEDVVDGWMVTLLELLPLLDKATLVRSYTSSHCAPLSPVRAIVPPEPPVPTPVQEHDVASLALAKGEVDQQVTSRALCCRILGGLAPHVDTALIERRFLNKAMASCQDTDYEVRFPPPPCAHWIAELACTRPAADGHLGELHGPGPHLHVQPAGRNSPKCWKHPASRHSAA